MDHYLNERFLLSCDTARDLYHTYAENLPIVDYHCHLPTDQIWEDRPFENITQVWLGGDHYKWRAMRLAGCPERLITGDGEDFEKFEAFAGVCERMCGAPVHHWAQMELHTYFGIDLPLNRKNARAIYDEAGRVMRERGYSPREMIRRADVRLVATTDDPASDLADHKRIATLPKDSFNCSVLPSYRPDNALLITNDGFTGWVSSLEQVTGTPIRSYDDLLAALEQRLDYFAELGTVISDQVVEYSGWRVSSPAKANAALLRRMRGESLSSEEVLDYFWRLLADLGAMYSRRGFIMQLHIGAYRNVNSRMLRTVGPNSGFDIMWDAPIVTDVTSFLDYLDSQGTLPRTVLYPLNSKDFEVLAASAASFPAEGVRGKVQLGAAWWHNDHKEGIISQLTAIGQQALLPYFLGMLTDSRSFLSYARHDYFRRILCSFVGERAESGEFVADKETMGELIADISYRNARDWFLPEK